jgi:hypothetical protein
VMEANLALLAPNPCSFTSGAPSNNKNWAIATGNFKILKKVRVPKFGRIPSFEVTISKTFFARMSL